MYASRQLPGLKNRLKLGKFEDESSYMHALSLLLPRHQFTPTVPAVSLLPMAID